MTKLLPYAFVIEELAGLLGVTCAPEPEHDLPGLHIPNRSDTHRTYRARGPCTQL
jgi:hypothetical protein